MEEATVRVQASRRTSLPDPIHYARREFGPISLIEPDAAATHYPRPAAIIPVAHLAVIIPTVASPAIAVSAANPVAAVSITTSAAATVLATHPAVAVPATILATNAATIPYAVATNVPATRLPAANVPIARLPAVPSAAGHHAIATHVLTTNGTANHSQPAVTLQTAWNCDH